MSLIYCTDIPQLATLSQRATNTLLANNCRLLKQIILEHFPHKYFAITFYTIPGIKVYDVQLLEFHVTNPLNGRIPQIRH